MKNRYRKRIFTLLLALALLLGLCPVVPKTQAETMATDVCPCCGKALSDISWTKISGLFASWTDLSKAGHYKMGKAFTENKEFTITGKVTIDFGGYKLQAKSGSRGFVVKSGGELTLLNTGGNNGRLEGHKTSAEGGAIKVEAGGKLNILGGRVIGTTMSYAGGAIYNEGTVNMAGGKVEGGKLTGKHGGNIYNAGEFNMYGGTLESGTTTKHGGNVYNTGTCTLYGGTVDGGIGTGGGNIYNLGTLEIRGGTVTGGAVTGDNGYGGNISNSGTLNIYDGTISDGTSEDHGGNIFCTKNAINMYGGTISGGTVTGGTTDDGTAFVGCGGNLYITGQTGVLKLYDGTITGGRNTNEASPGAANIMVNSGAQVYIYGGLVSTDSPNKGGNLNITSYATLEDETKQYSAVYVLGGTLTNTTPSGLDFFLGSGNKLEMYNCRYNGSQDIMGFLASCCCRVIDENGVTVWNAGYRDGDCTDCLYAQAMVEELVTPVTGGHSYEALGNNVYACSGCGRTHIFEKVAATLNGELFESAEAAFAAAKTGDKLVLTEDTTITQAAVSGYTLDLNGYTLTADVFTAATSGAVVDSSPNSTGKLLCADVTLAKNNPYLPVTVDDGLRFCPVGFTQWIEPVGVDTTKVKFYFTQRDRETIIDDAIKAGNTEVDVQLHLTWTGSDGTPKEKTVAFGSELVQKYAEKWNGRVFVATISGTSNITDLQVTYQVTSTATSGVTLSAKTIKAAGYIHENLTWEQINSFPIKRTDMTVEEMRQLCLDFMVFNKTFLWTPDQTVNYIRNSAGSADVMNQGQIYGGLPYVGVATGNPYRMMDYINPETGLVDMQKALPLLGTKDRLEYADLKFFGNQCSICVYWGWGRVMNSAKYLWTSSVVPNNDFVVLGDVVIPEGTTGWNKTYGTDECVTENGEQVLFEGYAQLQKADGMVYYTTAGHLIMAYSDPVVVRNEDGTINGDESYIYIIDQAQTWEEATNDSGDTYLRKKSVNAKKTFTQLFASNYIPFTFKEFLETDPIELTEVSLVKGSTSLITGTISEEDRSFQTAKTTTALTWSQLMDCSITSNYGIVDAYIIVTDNWGNELYKHAVRTETAGNKKLTLKETGAAVTTWETKALESGKTYSAQIVVQLATGERPTVFEGKLTV
ncbi:MAG: hypothetical protein IKA47_01210 [Oscillospiraceae bacterium]|nr:hypothetical protein [Oscillospiraceae bacterium]